MRTVVGGQATALAHTSSEGARQEGFSSRLRLSARQIQSSQRIFAEWEEGPFKHLKRVAIPERDAARGFSFAAHGHLFDDLVSVKVYCDALTGLSGSGQDEDPIVADLVASGSLRFTGRDGERVVRPGQLCIRDTKTSWQFSCDPGTRIRVVTIPRHLVVPRLGSPRALERSFVADAHTPELRFLVNFLEAIERSSGDLSDSAPTRHLALDACASIISGMLAGRSEISLPDHVQALLEAAKNVIEKNLDSSDLSPALVAQILHVSPRTLHRSFSASRESLMAFARRRRLERALEDLMASNGTASLSDLAARWQFADASHLIRQFKSSYGATPAAYVRAHTSARTEGTPQDAAPQDTN